MTTPPSRRSPASEGSTSDSNAPDGRPSSKPKGNTSTSPRRSSRPSSAPAATTGDGADPSSPTTSPTPTPTPTSATWHAWDDLNQEETGEITPTMRLGHGAGVPTVFLKATKAHGPDEEERWEQSTIAGTLTDHGGGLPSSALVSSTEGSPAKTSASPASAEGSPESDPDCSTSSHESLTLFDHAGCYLKTYRDCSPRTMVGTSASWWERWPTSGTASPGECSIHATSESPSGAVEFSLSDILEETVDPRYALSARAAKGILRRARVRGRNLPPALEAALEATAE